MSQTTPPPRSKISPLTAGEVAQIATDLQPYVGAQLQDCFQSASEVGLAFYHGGQNIWLWVDLNPHQPLVVRVPGKPPPRKKTPRPLTLFIKSRLTGRRLASVRADLARGRVLVLTFHRSSTEEAGTGPCEIEIHLFPHGQNVMARDGEKSVAEIKPKEIAVSVEFVVGEPGRSWTEIEACWRAAAGLSGETRAKPGAALGVAAPRDAADLDRDWKKLVEKKVGALEKMRVELQKKSDSVHRQAGDWLKAQGLLPQDLAEVPEAYRTVVSLDRSFSENIETLFKRAKENTRKLEGSRERITLVEKELAQLRAKGPAGFSKSRDAASAKGKQNLLVKADARGRKHALKDDLDVYIGKSAGDNLALLRRAQPFDYWLHLRDQPGSHAIIRRTRGRNVTDVEFQEAGRWVVEQTTGKRASELRGERFELLIVECRFVRPIKGDKLGRVHYTNDRVLGLRF